MCQGHKNSSRVNESGGGADAGRPSRESRQNLSAPAFNGVMFAATAEAGRYDTIAQ